jgi:Putative zinc-finger
VKILSGCREVTKLFDAFVDDELISAAQARVQYHIAGCGNCAVFVEEKIELKRLLSARDISGLGLGVCHNDPLRAMDRP